MKQKFLNFVAANPDATQADAARELGVTRQRISQLCRAEGVVMKRPESTRLTPFVGRKSVMGRDLPRFTGKAGNSTIGALAEVVVCADLLDRGIHVYRSMSPDSPCDLVALVDGKCFRLEVKSSRRDRTGNVVRPCNKPDHYDVLACVLPGPEVHYFANCEGWGIP